MKENRTILFVMSRLPFPASSGRKSSLYHYCRILSEAMGYRLVVAAFPEKGDNAEPKPSFIHRLELLPMAPAKNRIIHILKDSVLLRKKPMQVSLYWSEKAKQIIDRLVMEEKPDIVIGDMVRCMEYIKDIDTYRIADLDDRLSLRYQRQLGVNVESVNPYGAFLYALPGMIRKIMMIKPLKIFVMKNEIALLKKYELAVGKQCECTVFVAQSEAAQFNREIGEAKAIAIPIGVDTKHFAYIHDRQPQDYIGFLGVLNVAHNENAVRHFSEKILPEILKHNPNAKFLVIGGGASEELRNLESENIVFTGFVDDVREFMAKCKVFVCPLMFGSGIKTKNLEAMSMGIPVVTTTIGAENIDAKNEEDWIVADDDRAFAQAVSSLLEDDALRNRIGKNGSDFICRHFTWNAAQNAFEALFASGQFF